MATKAIGISKAVQKEVRDNFKNDYAAILKSMDDSVLSKNPRLAESFSDVISLYKSTPKVAVAAAEQFETTTSGLNSEGASYMISVMLFAKFGNMVKKFKNSPVEAFSELTNTLLISAHADFEAGREFWSENGSFRKVVELMEGDEKAAGILSRFKGYPDSEVRYKVSALVFDAVDTVDARVFNKVMAFIELFNDTPSALKVDDTADFVREIKSDFEKVDEVAKLGRK